MAGNGGARPGSGAKKNQHRIPAGELRKALEAKLGMPFTELLAETQLKLFNDFQQDINVKEYISFTENMSKRLLENPTVEIADVTSPENMSESEIDLRISNLLTRKALSDAKSDDQSVISDDTATDA